jgi:hypothetical protein
MENFECFRYERNQSFVADLIRERFDNLSVKKENHGTDSEHVAEGNCEQVQAI